MAKWTFVGIGSGFDTLALRIWTLSTDEFLSQVAPVVLILLGIATLGLLFRPDTARLKR